MRHSKLLIFVVSISLAISSVFVFRVKAQIGESIQFPAPTIPEVNQLPGIQFVSPEKANNIQPSPPPTPVRRSGFRLPTIGKFIKTLGENIKEGVSNLKSLVTPPATSIPSKPIVQPPQPKPQTVQKTPPTPAPKPEAKLQPASVVQTVVLKPQAVAQILSASPKSAPVVTPPTDDKLEKLQLDLTKLEQKQKSQFTDLFSLIGQVGKINSLGSSGDSGKLTIYSPTLVSPAGISDEDIPNNITVETTNPANFSNNVTITGRFLRIGSTITVDGVKNFISSSDGLTLIPTSGNPLTTSYLNATSTATSTFAGPISATTTTADGRLTISGATTTGELWLNPYAQFGGRVHIASSSPSTNLAVGGLGFSVSTSSYFGYNVGIGTTTPEATLAVQGSGLFSGNVRIGGIVIDSGGGISGGGTTSVTNLVVTNISTSTFRGPITSNATDGRFIIHGATTTGELWLNPYGGKVHIASSSPDRVNLVSGGIGLSISTTSYFGASAGFGTATPGRILSVQGDAVVSGLLNVANLTSAGSVNSLSVLTGGVFASSTSAFTGLITSYGGLMVTASSSINSSLNVLGRLGVATATPSAMLAIRGDVLATQFNVSEVATSTFANIEAASTTVNGRLIVQGATTTGELWLNPYGGKLHIASSSPSANLLVQGIGFSVSTTSYFGQSVGIGTTTPLVSNALAIGGNLYVHGPITAFRGVSYTWPSADGTSGQVLQTNGSAVLSWAQGSQWVTSGSNIYYAIGNVGVGTTTPTATRFQIAATTTPQLLLSDPNGGVDLKHVYASSSAGDLAFGTLNDALITYTERFRITNAGRVGIGTTSPNAMLALTGELLATAVVTNSSATSSFGGPITVASTTADGNLIVAGATTTGQLLLNPWGGAVAIGASTTLANSASSTQLFVTGRVPRYATASTTTGTTPEALFVQGRYIYTVNSGSDTFQIFEHSTSSPSLISSTAMGSNPVALYVAGRYAYIVIQGTQTLQIVDISNPRVPFLLGSVAISTNGLEVRVQGRYAFITRSGGGGGVTVVDVANPSNPTVTATLTSDIGPLDVQGKYLYTASSGTSDTFFIYDISNPNVTPVLAGSVALGGGPIITSIYVQNEYAYLSRNLGGSGNSLNNDLRVIDVRNPASPVAVGNVKFGPGVSPSDVYVQGRYAYVTDSALSNLFVTDVSDVTAPFVVGVASTTNAGNDIYVTGRYAYITSSNGKSLQVYDLGGAYIQQLEAGGLEVGTLQVQDELLVNNNLDIRNSLSVGGMALFNGPVAVHTASGLATSSAFTVDAYGRVGIGTSTPFATSTTMTGGALQIVSSTSPNFVLTDMRGGVNLKHFYASSTGGDLAFGTLTDDLFTYSERFRITNVGRVGIGTTSPNAKLAVAGDILATQFNVSEVATSTFANIEAASTTINGRLIIQGATTTGELWLNPYGGRIIIASSSPSSANLLAAGAGFSVSTTTYFGNSVGIGTTTPTLIGSPAQGLAIGGSLYVTGSTTVTELTLTGQYVNKGILNMGSSTPLANTLYKENIVKGWIFFDGAQATPNIKDSFNVSSITDTGTGDWTLNWLIPFRNNYYASAGTCRSDGTIGQSNLRLPSDMTTTSLRILCTNSSDAVIDGNQVSIIVIGSQ